MMVGRNDPCPCGSGKKYKKCCLKNDLSDRHQRHLQEQEQARQELSAEQRPDVDTHDGRDEHLDFELPGGEEEPTGSPWSGSEVGAKPDPHREALSAWWDEFEAADCEGRIALFTKALDEPDLLDELAYDMLSLIHQDIDRPGERQRLEILIGALRERAPKVYADDAVYLLSWLIEDALVGGRLDAAASLGKEMASTAGRDIDVFSHVADQLAYHGQLATLVEMMRIAWPLVEKSPDVLPWAVDEFVNRALWLEALHYWEHASAPRADDPEITKRLEFYTDSLRPEWFAELLELLAGPAESPETRSEAEPQEGEETARQRRKRRRAEKGRRMYLLSVEFLGYAFREERVPYAKAELAREKLWDYLNSRAEGKLGPDGSFRSGPRRKKKSKLRCGHDPTLLCADRLTLDRYLAGLFGMFGDNAYAMAALMELMPAWLRFLRRRELIDAEQHAAAFDELAALNVEMLPHWKAFRYDPTLYRGALRAWEAPPREPVEELQGI